MGFFQKVIRKIGSGHENAGQDALREQTGAEPKEPLTSGLKDNLGRIREQLGNSSDIIVREMRIGQSGRQRAGIVYADGLADKTAINDFILETLTKHSDLLYAEDQLVSGPELIGALKEDILPVDDLKYITDFETLYTAVLSGETVILLDGISQGISVSTQGWKDRGVTENSAESVVRGPREAFTETLRTNTAQIRRKIKNPNLWLETKAIGRQTKTDVAIMFIQGIANEGVVKEVRERLNRIDIDGILESGYIEELIQDETVTPFPTIYNTERPDVVAAELLEGKVAILVDGTPFVLIVPAILVSFFHSAEDYYHPAGISSLVRLLRYVGSFIALLGPSLYVAITTFHQEMLPTPLLISLASQREGIPFPAFVEAVLMEVAFEILREAGLRMPRTIGPAVSIVGTLVIGQAAVEAGIVSAAMVIVVSTTAISSFVFPSYSLSNAFRMLRFPMMALAGCFGLLGIIVGVIAIILHLSSLRTFGVPYLSPFAPFIPSDQGDTIFRLPHWALLTRPRLISQSNVYRKRNMPYPKPKSRQEQKRPQ